MKIFFHRHATQRLKLYKIDREHLIRSLMAVNLKDWPENQKRVLTFEGIRNKFGTPIRLAVIKERDTLVVKTNFPIRKGKRK